MSGWPAKRAGTPLRRKRHPGPASARPVSTASAIHRRPIPIVSARTACRPGTRCAPISATTTGRARRVARARIARKRALLAVCLRAVERAISIVGQRGAGVEARLVDRRGEVVFGHAAARMAHRWRCRSRGSTLALATPGTAASARSTRATQDAHVMPTTGSRIVVATLAPRRIGVAPIHHRSSR